VLPFFGSGSHITEDTKIDTLIKPPRVIYPEPLSKRGGWMLRSNGEAARDKILAEKLQLERERREGL
jgi:hypothetical protein